MKKEIIIALFWLLLSLYLAYSSYQLGLGSGGKPGAGFFPFATALVIGLIALVRVVGLSPERSETTLATSARERRNIFYVVAGMLAYALLLDTLGFALCTFFLLGFYSRVVAAQPWRPSFAFAVFAAVGSHLFFDILLRAQLPRGLLDLLL